MRKTRVEIAALLFCGVAFVTSSCDGGDVASTGDEAVGVTESSLFFTLCNLPATSATASANPKQPASNAIDGKFNTRWESASADNQILTVDLGKTQPVWRVSLTWETACGKDYDIDTAPAAAGPWTNQVKVRGNTQSGYNELSFPDIVNARFVRMNGLKRCTQYGFSLYEFTPESVQQNCLLDKDGDGFGATGSACGVCPAAPAQGGDCNDANANVKPNQTAFFTTQASGSWDYNCSNVIELQSTNGSTNVCTNASGVKQTSCDTCAYQFAQIDATDCGKDRCGLQGNTHINCH